MDDDADSRGTKPAYELPESYQPLFTSNEPPLADQMPGIVQSAVVAERVKVNLDLQIHQARMHLIRLERQAFYASRHIQRCKCVLSPIRRIPVEILSKIFTAYADLLLPQISDVKKGVWMLGHICGHWRAVAVSTPALWSSFSFRCDPRKHTGAASAAIADEFLLRSSGHPLSITFDCMGGPFCIAGGPCTDVFTAVLAHCQRWRTANIRIPPHLYTELRMVKDNIPNLTTLRLNLLTLSREPPVAFHDTETFRSCPRLVDLQLTVHTANQLIDFPWHQLTRYSGSAVRGNTDVLASAPNIVDCILRYDRVQAAEPLVHQLQCLKLFDGGPRSLIALDNLTLPALTYLSTHTDFLQAVVALVRRSHAPLRVLELSAVQFSQPSWFTRGAVSLLEVAPGVTRLAISGRPGPKSAPAHGISDIFRALTLTHAAPAPILPHLAHLMVTGVVLDEAFVDMIESRCALADTNATATTTATARLRSLRISKFGEPEMHNLLRLRRIELQPGCGLKLMVDFENPDARRAWEQLG
ncbi:hypothetical protein C8R46DRAFT_269006 [Mycena filopes]|nr:hypothetical protein C8R46DRAFT_269006 [Mycena filopes]